ncbi:putative odorant receptor 92a isoform X2 [Hermetia illucens]|uniref:putative odorant receptor 92a isoform X2 n=1 Tax=Hermetia illucens TaxID=343691 RepID=UPI0018CC45CC|nr:putative odorant receptor 92a isoform X2 [Hermetia illucens]
MKSISGIIFQHFPPVGKDGEIGSISLNLYCGRLLGIPFSTISWGRFATLAFRFYSLAILSTISILYTYCEVLDMMDAYQDMDALTQNISLSFTHIGGVLKGINVLYHLPEIMEIVNILKDTFRKYTISDKQRKILTSSEKFNTYIFLGYMSAVSFTAFAGAFVVIANPSIAGSSFPYRSKLPKYLPLSVRVCYHATSALVIAVQVVILDSLNINFINQIRCQLRVLNLNVENLKDGKVSNPKRLLSRCVQHHQIIMDLRNRIERIFSYQLLIQFFTSLLIFALTGFQATTARLSDGMIILYMYLGCIFSELFIYCFFANQVMDQNQLLAITGYDSAWYTFGTKYTKDLIFFLLRAQKPVTFSVGGFFDLSLNTFTGILGKSYSFIALLRQVYSE